MQQAKASLVTSETFRRRIVRWAFFAISTAVMASLPDTVLAEPTGGVVSIVSLRPYGTGQLVYVEVDSGAFCGTTVFTIDLSLPSGREMYAAALTAVASNKSVRLEVATQPGCNGWGTKLLSLYISTGSSALRDR